MRTLAGLLVVLSLAACAAEDDELVFESDIIKGDDATPRPFGTWRRELGEGEAGFSLLVLKTDRTFHYSQELVRCEPGHCTDELSGRYRFASSHGRRYVVLYNDDTLWYSLEYRLAEDETTLAVDYAGDDFRDPTNFEKGDGWCDAVADCELQEIPNLECVGGHFVCTAQKTCDQACGGQP